MGTLRFAHPSAGAVAAVALRYLLATRPEVLTRVLGIVYRADLRLPDPQSRPDDARARRQES
jgi:hypothetical protein